MKNERPKLTIGATQDKHAENHSRRLYTPFSADRSLEKYNVVIFDCGDDREHFNAFFQPAIERYNSRQKRTDRKKDLDYLSALEDGREGYGKGKSKEQPFYHDVVQIGNRYTNGVTDDDFDVDYWRGLKKEGKLDEASAYVEKHLTHSKINDDVLEIYIEIANEILENLDHKYDGILIHGIIIHCDEPNGTPHMDIRYSFYTEGETTGLDTRVSQRKALAKLGFHTDREKTALQKFREAFKDRIEKKMRERGYERDVKNEHRKHKSVVAYEMEQRAKEATKKTEKAIETLTDIKQFFIDKLYAYDAGVFNRDGEYCGESITVEDFYKELRSAIIECSTSIEEDDNRNYEYRQQTIKMKKEIEDEQFEVENEKSLLFFIYMDALQKIKPELFDDDGNCLLSLSGIDEAREFFEQELKTFVADLEDKERKQSKEKEKIEKEKSKIKKKIKVTEKEIQQREDTLKAKHEAYNRTVDKLKSDYQEALQMLNTEAERVIGEATHYMMEAKKLLEECKEINRLSSMDPKSLKVYVKENNSYRQTTIGEVISRHDGDVERRKKELSKRMNKMKDIPDSSGYDFEKE